MNSGRNNAAAAIKADQLFSAYYFKSDFYEIKNWTFDFIRENEPGTGYNDCMCIMFVRRGNFHFNLSRQAFHLHTGYVLIDKPDYEYRLRPAAGQCSILNFSHDFYRQFVSDLNLRASFFFSNPGMLSLMLKTTPEMEYLHYRLLSSTSAGKLDKDNMVIELLRLITTSIKASPAEDEINPAMRKYHLVTIEKAKEYINEHFFRDVSLFEISSFACVSPFHFSRIFKKFTSFSPHQYLQHIRLKHSEILLKNSTMPIAEISFQSGFTTAEYFATAFRQKYNMSPSQFRKTAGGWSWSNSWSGLLKK